MIFTQLFNDWLEDARARDCTQLHRFFTPIFSIFLLRTANLLKIEGILRKKPLLALSSSELTFSSILALSFTQLAQLTLTLSTSVLNWSYLMQLAPFFSENMSVFLCKM